MNSCKGVRGRGLTRSELPPCRAAFSWVKPSTDLANLQVVWKQVNLLKSWHNGGWDGLVRCRVLVGCGPPGVSKGEGQKGQLDGKCVVPPQCVHGQQLVWFEVPGKHSSHRSRSQISHLRRGSLAAFVNVIADPCM